MVSSIISNKGEFKPQQPHTVQTETYLYLTAADVGGPVFTLYVCTLAYTCWEPSTVCDSRRRFKDYTNQRDKDGWEMRGVWSTLYMLYVYLRFGRFWSFRFVECRSAYDDGLLCKHRYTNTVGPGTVAGLWRTWKVLFLISESGDLLSKKFSWVIQLKTFTLSVAQPKREKSLMLHIQMHSFIKLHCML